MESRPPWVTGAEMVARGAGHVVSPEAATKGARQRWGSFCELTAAHLDRRSSTDFPEPRTNFREPRKGEVQHSPAPIG